MKKYLFAVLFCLVSRSIMAAGPGDFYQLAEKEYYGNHYTNAEKNLNIALKLNYDDWRIHQLLSYCHYMKGDYDLSLKEGEESLGLRRDNSRLSSFVDRLRAKLTGEKVKTPFAAEGFLESKEEAAMPLPPDQDDQRKPDVYSNSEPALTANPGFRKLGTFVYPSFGISIPSSPAVFSGEWAPSASLGLGLDFALTQGLWLQLEGTYNSFMLSGAPAGYTSTGGLVTDVTALVGLRFSPFDGNPVSPYITAGVGLGFYGAAPATFSSGNVFDQTQVYSAGFYNVDPAGQIGIGLDCSLHSDYLMFIEGDFVFTNDTLVELDYGIIKAGIRYRLY